MAEKRNEMIKAFEESQTGEQKIEYIGPKQLPPGRKSIEEKRAEIVRKEMDQIKGNIRKAMYKVAELLFEIREARHYKLWGYSRFEAYVEEEVGMSSRKAYELLSIWRCLVNDLNISPQEIQKLDWTKAAVIARVANENNIKLWMEKARTMSARKLLDDARAAKSNGPSETLKSESFSLYRPQQDTIHRALNLAEKKTGSDKKGHNLEMICLEFISSNLSDKNLSLNWLKKRIEDVYGVSILVIDNKKSAQEIMREIINEYEEFN